MAINLEIHPIQANILLVLLHRPSARFSEMNNSKTPSDQFSFHLKTLLNQNLLAKGEKGLYQLTDKGKEFANRFDTEAGTIERQSKVAVLICCQRKIGEVKEYLIQQRLKQPYFGFYGFFGGKIKWGETVYEAAKRELKEETGLKGELKLVGVKHKMDYQNNDELLEDKFFFVFKATNLKGRLVVSFEGGKNCWMTENKINELKCLFDGVDLTLSMVNKNHLAFDEKKYKVVKY